MTAAPRASALGENPLPLDSLDMWRATLRLPEQLRQAAVLARETLTGIDPTTWDRSWANVSFLGMGGSGMAGDVVSAVCGPRLSLPVTTSKSYRLPRFVGPGSLVFAISCSGETEETVTAATEAWEAGATVAVIAGGGALSELAAAHRSPRFSVPLDLPQPRTALGAMAVPPLQVLQACGLLADVDVLIDSAIEQLFRRRDELLGRSSPVQRLATAIARTVPLLHGGEGPAAVAALRWKTQINENAKSPAFSAVQPELCHNEAAGWGQHGDITRQVLTLVILRCASDHPQVARRIEIIKDLLLEVVHDIVEVWGTGETDLAQLLDLVMVGDVVSLLLAGREGLDPGPVPVLQEIKSRLRC